MGPDGIYPDGIDGVEFDCPVGPLEVFVLIHMVMVGIGPLCNFGYWFWYI